MTQLTEREKYEMKLRLLSAMGAFIQKETSKDNNLGWLPDEIESMMADAAFNVILAVNATNAYIEKEGPLAQVSIAYNNIIDESRFMISYRVILDRHTNTRNGEFLQGGAPIILTVSDNQIEKLDD